MSQHSERRIPLAMAMMYGANPGLAKDQEIAQLKAELNRLTNLLEAATIAIEANKNLVKQLKDRNERLTKTGDAMYRQAVEDAMGVWLFPAYEAWRKSKDEEA